MNRKFALIGYPLKHTMSPPIHQRLFSLSGKKGEYSVIEIKPEELSDKKQILDALDGYNVTIPHKISITEQLDYLDGSAERYGAVNCVFNEDGESIGYNTDCIGFLRALESKNLWIDKNVLLLGLGGAGHMMAIETVINGGILTVAVRPESVKKAEAFAEQTTEKYPDAVINVIDINEITGEFDIMLNATPVGMYPDVDGCPVSDSVIDHCGSLFDAIYNPVKTKLVQKFIAKKKPALSGMAMLVWQAAVAHEIWDDVSYEDKDIDRLIADMEKAVVEKFR